MKKRMTTLLLVAGAVLTLASVVPCHADSRCNSSAAKSGRTAPRLPRDSYSAEDRNEIQFARDYRERRRQGDDAIEHGYRADRDGWRSNRYGYGYGYGGWGYGGWGYGGYGSAGPSWGWSRGNWSGHSDLPTYGYSR